MPPLTLLLHKIIPNQQALLNGNNLHQYPDGREQEKSDRLLYKATALDEPAHPSAEQPTNVGCQPFF